MPPGPPTPAQARVLRAIQDLSRKLGYPPTMREVGEACGFSSTQAVYDHVVIMERRGLVSRARRSARTLRVLWPEAVAPPPRRRRKP